MSEIIKFCRQISAGADPESINETLAEQAYRSIISAIMSGELKPGQKLSEPALARQYGISRGPLREALHRLQERKLITRSANQGARIVELSLGALGELFIVREALECTAARLAATNATVDDLAGLRAVVVDGGSVRGVENGDDFHFAIVQASHSSMLIQLLCEELWPLLRLYRGHFGGSRPREGRAIFEHQRIVSAIEDGDPELAELLMRRHIGSARSRRETAITLANDIPDNVTKL